VTPLVITDCDSFACAEGLLERLRERFGFKVSGAFTITELIIHDRQRRKKRSIWRLRLHGTAEEPIAERIIDEAAAYTAGYGTALAQQ
jgi:hypothetical protein